MFHQNLATIRSDVSFHGKGIHSGQNVKMMLKPAEWGSGIHVVRKDKRVSQSVIPVDWSSITQTAFCTVLGNEFGVSVGTIEHLMAALAGTGVTDVLIELDGGEIPILDGSAALFCEAIEQVGLSKGHKLRPYIRVLKPLEVKQGTSWISLTPSDTFSIDFLFDFQRKGWSLPAQKLCLEGSYASIMKNVASARTIGFYEDYALLQSQGLAKGGSLENALVYKDGFVMNKEGLRYSDECVRHKILDVIGDLSLLGAPLMGKVTCYMSGHTLNARLMQTLMSSLDHWECASRLEYDLPLSHMMVRPPSFKTASVFC